MNPGQSWLNQVGPDQNWSGQRWTPQGELVDECLNNVGYWKVCFGPGKHTWRKTPAYGLGQFVNDVPTGCWCFYYANGQVHSIGHYSFGLKTHYWQYFCPDGSVRCSGYYSNGQKVGSHQKLF